MNTPLTEVEELTLTNAAKHFLKEIAGWSKFLAVLGFVFIGIMLVFSFLSGTIFSALPQTQIQAMPFDFGYLMTIVYFSFALIYFFPVLYLFKFSTKMKVALQNKDNDVLAKAFDNLKSHYKFIGVFTIITISLYVLVIIFAAIEALAL